MAKKRIPEVPRDGSDADFVPENYMLIDGAEGSAKMRMDLFGKASAIEELDEVKYEMPEGGIPKDDLSEAVRGSLDLADSALQASDIEGKAEKSEMSITNVSGDTTKKNIQLKTGLSQNVVVDHQDISGKADKSEMSVSAVSGDDTKKTIQLKSGLTQNVVIEHQDISGKADTSAMSITDVSGDATKKKIQLKAGLSQDVVVVHQDISGKADKSEMSISAGEDDTKRTIQLKNGTSQSVVVSHQDISGKAEKSEMDISAVSGDETKKKIQLKSGLAQNVVVEHQDISGKAEKSEMSISAVSGDATKMKIQLKSGTSQNVVVEHQDLSGKADKSELLISAVSGDDTKKTIQLKSGTSQNVVVEHQDISGKADAEDVLTTWTRARENPSQVTGTLSLNSTIDPTRIEVNLDNTIAGDLLVGHLVPTVINDDRGKVLMVTSTTGIAWQPLPPTELQEYPGSPSAHTVQGTLGFITYSGPERTSAYLAVTDSDPTCLGMLVPPVTTEDDGRILTVDATNGPVWRDPPQTDIEWVHDNPYSQDFGILKFGTTSIEEDNVRVAHHTSAYIDEIFDASHCVGSFVPNYAASDTGKVLMVDPTIGPSWASLPETDTRWVYGDPSDTRWGTVSLETAITQIGEEWDDEQEMSVPIYGPHHTSSYITYNSETTWLGTFAPPHSRNDVGNILMVGDDGPEWKEPSELRIYYAGAGIEIDEYNRISARVTAVTYDKDEYSRPEPYNTNCHKVTNGDLTAGYFYIALQLAHYNTAGKYLKLMGDIYGFRGIYASGSSAYNITSSHISSLELMLGKDDKTPIYYTGTTPIIIRKIDASEISLSDRNVSGTSSECRFHFSCMNSCRSNMEPVDDKAYYLLIKVNLAASTSIQENDKFVIYASWAEF